MSPTVCRERAGSHSCTRVDGKLRHDLCAYRLQLAEEAGRLDAMIDVDNADGLPSRALREAYRRGRGQA